MRKNSVPAAATPASSEILGDAPPFPVILNEVAPLVDDELKADSIVWVKKFLLENKALVGLPSSRKQFEIPISAYERVTQETIARVSSIPVTSNSDEGSLWLHLREPTRSMDELVLPAEVRAAATAAIDSILNGDELDAIAREYGQTQRTRHLFIYAGMPGTGKTTLVDAIARQVGARVLQIGTTVTGSSYHTVTERSNFDALAVAGRAEPKVVVLVDDGDDLIRQRNGSTTARLHDSDTTGLLQALDANPKAIVFFTTNADPSQIDAALRSRATVVHFRPASAEQRVELVRRLIRDSALEEGIDLGPIARAPISLREVDRVCRHAVMQAARAHRDTGHRQTVGTSDLERALALVRVTDGDVRKVGFSP